MPALPVSTLVPGGGGGTDEAHDALQVICAWPVSGQYGTGTRVLYYVLIATCLLARREEWLVNPCLAAALVLPALAAIHGIVLTAMHNPMAVDMDIFGAFQLCAIGILAAPVTVMMSRTYFNDPGRNTIFLWTGLLLVGLLCMTVEFYRINTHPCTEDASGHRVSPHHGDFVYVEGNNCGLTCSVEDGPFSSARGGSANNIYVIPAPHGLTFGAATLLSAACCVHAILCMVSMWGKVLEINWRRRFGRSSADNDNDNDHDDKKRDEVIPGSNGATQGMIKNLNQKIGYFIKILAIPVFGGAGLAILIVGELNFFSPQVNYQTEPMSNVGQWAPVAGTSMAMMGSLYLLLARHASEEEEERKSRKTSFPLPSKCAFCHDGQPATRLPSPRSRRRMSLPNQQQRVRRRSEAFALDLQRMQSPDTLLSQIPEPLSSRRGGFDAGFGRPERENGSGSRSRSRSRSRTSDASSQSRGKYRRKVERFFFRAGEVLGTPARDYITEPECQRKHYVDVPPIPGEWVRNPRRVEVDGERGEYEGEQLHPLRSRAPSFNGSTRSAGRGSGSLMPVGSLESPPPVHRRET